MPGSINYDPQPNVDFNSPENRAEKDLLLRQIDNFTAEDAAAAYDAYFNPKSGNAVPLPPRRDYGSPGEKYIYTPVEQTQVNAAYQMSSPREERAASFYPPAFRAMLGSYFGNQGDITQHFFAPSDRNALREDFLGKASDYYYTGGAGVNPLSQFSDAPAQDVSRFVPFNPRNQAHISPYLEYTQAQPHRTQNYGIGNVLQGIDPFTQGAYYEESPEGIRLRNQYGQRDVNVLLPMEPR